MFTNQTSAYLSSHASRHQLTFSCSPPLFSR